ncbi:hypothetical protein TcCL_Unassigned00856 [Trypanosoma cruzi]|nr:hypothetical protein TcCL_Unassigned00856 [Trypanosoma cruzi]
MLPSQSVDDAWMRMVTHRYFQTTLHTRDASCALRHAALTITRDAHAPSTTHYKEKRCWLPSSPIPRAAAARNMFVRAFILSVHAATQSVPNGVRVRMCLCVWQRLYLQSSCAPQESPKKATAERGR